jgi:hypothetical protein
VAKPLARGFGSLHNTSPKFGPLEVPDSARGGFFFFPVVHDGPIRVDATMFHCTAFARSLCVLTSVQWEPSRTRRRRWPPRVMRSKALPPAPTPEFVRVMATASRFRVTGPSTGADTAIGSPAQRPERDVRIRAGRDARSMIASLTGLRTGANTLRDLTPARPPPFRSLDDHLDVEDAAAPLQRPCGYGDPAEPARDCRPM